MESTSEIKRLQSCINDLISILALPAIWTGSESSQILGTLLEVLLTMLRLDFSYARLHDTSDGSPIEVVRFGDRRHSSGQPQQFTQALHPWLIADQTGSRCVIPDPGGNGEISIASFALGLNQEGSVLVAGSRRADFPTEVERLLLRVAANQAGIGLQEARRSGEQKRIAEMLEQRVGERTARLTAVNEELRRSEAYLAEAQRLSRTGSFGWKLPTGEITWSKETFRIFQYDQNTTPTIELILRRVHPEDATAVKQTIERASQEGKDFDFEHRLLMPDGSCKHVHVVARAISVELGSIEFVGAVMDVTDRKRSEEALLRSETYLAEGQKLSHTGSWAFNPREPVYWSEENFRIWGFDPQEGLPDRETIMKRIHPEDRTKMLECVQKTLREKADYVVDFRIMLPDGTVKYIHGLGHSVFSAAGELVEVVGTNVDATERKRAEEERERFRQTESDLARISRANTMGELTASLAHEVNQPIAAAVTDARTCLRWLERGEPDVEEAREAAARVVKDATRAAEIISRTRLLFKKGAPQWELVDVNEIIRDILALMQSEIVRYAITLRTELAEEIPPITGDRVQLQQVMMNLILNSIDAMKDGCETRELVIGSQQIEGGQVMVLVRDTGVGLPPKQADQIFNAFFTTKAHGTGMGLRISRSIVETHGGRLWAADNSPCGASFFLTLPTRIEAVA